MTHRIARFAPAVVALVVSFACGSSAPPAATTGAAPAKGDTVTRASFGTMPDGTPVDVYTLTNANGLEVRAITYGGIIVSLKTPDRNGQPGDIVLGFDNLEGYIKSSPYFGAIIGRYGNRIAKGRFTLDGHTYTLATNDGANSLHGGVKGFDKVVWHAEPVQNDKSVAVIFTHTSPDGDEGYPGTLQVRVTYTLTDENTLEVDYHATTDKATPVNLTQHSYFNLSGAGSGDVLGELLQIDASHYTPVGAGLIPTGEIAPVQGTPFDFRKATAIGARINDDNAQLKLAGGYDHNFVLDRNQGGLAHAARVVDPASGRTLDVETTEPGIQFYSGNFLDGTITGKGGKVYPHRGAFCLETQHFPDSPNHPNFPSTILRPGQEYNSTTVFTFGVQK